MSNRRTTRVGLWLLTAANLFQVIGTYVASLYFVWRKRGDASTNVLAAAILGAVYWLTQGLANFYPGVAWTDPEFLKADQTLNDIAPQMILDPILLGVVSLGWHLARKPAR